MALAASSLSLAQVTADSLVNAPAVPEQPSGVIGCVVDNPQGSITSGFLGWSEGGTHAVLVDPTGTGDPGDPGCAGSFGGQQFRLSGATFLVADGTAFSSPNGETGIGTTTYTISVHPLATPGDPTAGPAAAIESVQQVLNMDASATYNLAATLESVVTGPFFVAITFNDFEPNSEVATTLWDGVARPLGRQFADNGSGFVDHTDFFNNGNLGWVVMSASGDFEPLAGGPLPESQAVNVNSPWAMAILMMLVAGFGLVIVRRAI
ncbi:MAG: hypothetical protein RQ741_11735 [Wenzhouxiangellaceae bacterium]|nr:hypothetical protein [Wenzhouxiangellaceae bacterium]